MLEALSRNMAFAYRRIAERAGRPTYVDEQVSIADNAKAFVCGPNNVTLLRRDADPAAAVRRADEAAVSDGYTGVYGVATIPTMRRRGYGEALTKAAMNAAAHLPAALQSSQAGIPLYLKMGFREIAQFEVWRPVQPAALPC